MREKKKPRGHVLLGSTVSWNQYRCWLKQLIPKEHAWSNTATRKWVGHFEIRYKTVPRKDKTIWLLKPVWILTMPFIALSTVTTSSSWIFGTLVCLSVDTLQRHPAARLRDLLCSSRKYPYPKPPRRATELPRRGGSPKGGNFPGCWGLFTEVFFQGVWTASLLRQLSVFFYCYWCFKTSIIVSLDHLLSTVS